MTLLNSWMNIMSMEFSNEPFASIIDVRGVGKLVKLGVELGKKLI